jgi:hypothetical protein
MKISVIDTVRSLNKELGVDNSAGFPSIVDSDYRQVFDKFIDTTVVKDIKKKWPADTASLYVAMAFVNYIRGVDSKSAPSINLFQCSLNLITLLPNSESMYNYLYLNRFINHMRQYTHTASIKHFEYNDFLEAYFNVSVEGYIAYKTKGRYTLDGLINSEIKPLVFPRMLPDQLKTTYRDKPRKLLDLHQLKKRPNDWYKLIHDKKLDLVLYVSRAKFGTLVFKYEFNIPNLIFANGSSKQTVFNTILARWDKIRKL